MGSPELDNSNGSRRVEIIYASELKSVDDAETLVLEMAQGIGFDEDEQHRIGIALREGMVNAVVHGNQYNADKKVRLRASAENGTLTVIIADEGKGFEMSKVPDPLAQENLLKESGRGILLMQAFVDEFQVRRLQPCGTEITMVKHLTQP